MYNVQQCCTNYVIDNMSRVIDVWVDGSCTDNGTLKAKAGIGIYYSSNDNRNYSSRLTRTRQTNNTAELVAILYVLETNQGSSLRINTDSQYCINCITQFHAKWEKTQWRTVKGTPVESAEIIRCILAVIQRRKESGLSTDFVHVKGHSGDEGNEAADKLARAGSANGSEGGRLKLMRKCGLPV